MLSPTEEATLATGPCGSRDVYGLFPDIGGAFKAAVTALYSSAGPTNLADPFAPVTSEV